MTAQLDMFPDEWAPCVVLSAAIHDAGRFYERVSFVKQWNGRNRCVLKTDLRDWLHRLDAHGEMRGDQLCESVGSARGDSTGFMNSLNLTEQLLAHMESGGWIVREARSTTSRWVPGPSFDIKRFELWVSADGPQDGSGMFPLEWQP